MKIKYTKIKECSSFKTWRYWEWKFNCGETGKAELGIRLLGLNIRFKDGCMCGETEEPDIFIPYPNVIKE